MIYDASHVEVLLPKVFDSTFPNKVSPPDPDMPRGTVDPRRVSDPWTLIADMELAWRGAPLSIEERKVLFSAYVLVESSRWITAMMGVRYETMIEYRESGLQLLVNHMNGVDTEYDNGIW